MHLSWHLLIIAMSNWSWSTAVWDKISCTTGVVPNFLYTTSRSGHSRIWKINYLQYSDAQSPCEKGSCTLLHHWWEGLHDVYNQTPNVTALSIGLGACLAITHSRCLPFQIPVGPAQSWNISQDPIGPKISNENLISTLDRK